MSELDATPLFRFFDPLAEYGVVEHNLPHWMQTKTVCFITWRTWDSMPESVVAAWHTERTAWIRTHNNGVPANDARTVLNKLNPEQRREYYRLFSARWEAYLDKCHGLCPFRGPELAKIVVDALMHFDGVRYELTDFVVMPNHVHVLVACESSLTMLGQCKSWKHFTAVKLNSQLARKGRFWEPESFDHLVRSEEQWRYLRGYIKENPARAGLGEGEYLHYSRQC